MHMVNGVGKNSANLTLSRIHRNPEVGFYGEEKNWAGPFFPLLDKVQHHPYSERNRVGEKCCAYD